MSPNFCDRHVKTKKVCSLIKSKTCSSFKMDRRLDRVSIGESSRLESRVNCFSKQYSLPVQFSVLVSIAVLMGVSGLQAHGIHEDKSVIHNQREDLFSSTSKLEELVESELQIVDLLETFADYALERAQTIKT